MAKRTTEAYVSQMEKTATYWKKKADREYAYAKNSGEGYHYGYVKKAYTKAKEFSTFYLGSDTLDEEEDDLELYGLDRDEIAMMDDGDRRTALEDAGLDPDDYDDF